MLPKNNKVLIKVYKPTSGAEVSRGNNKPKAAYTPTENTRDAVCQAVFRAREFKSS